MRRFADVGACWCGCRIGLSGCSTPKSIVLACWIYVGETVWVKLGEHSATLLNSKGETAECWNGGQMSKY